jgi:hypothetical protein
MGGGWCGGGVGGERACKGGCGGTVAGSGPGGARERAEGEPHPGGALWVRGSTLRTDGCCN